MDRIDAVMQGYLKNSEIPGGHLIVRKGGRVVYNQCWGYLDLEQKEEIRSDSIYRLMSMTKPITAVAVLQQIEQGKIGLDDPISRWLPAFKEMQVVDDPKLAWPENPSIGKMLPQIIHILFGKVKTVPAERAVTVRDLLSHSSGIQQGMVSLVAMARNKKTVNSMAEEAAYFASRPLDFQPGTGTGYSPLAGFDLLLYIVELASGEKAEDYLKKHIFEPLRMNDTFFWPNEEQKNRIVTPYHRTKKQGEGGKLVVTKGKPDAVDNMLHRGPGFTAGCGGLFSTAKDYERFAAMLANGGTLDGKLILKPETVELMHTEAPKRHLEPDPGMVWGLGVKIRQSPKKAGSFAAEGTYGWSGAFGTHFFVSPADGLDCVWMVNRTDLDGAGSYISNKVEELVFGIWGLTEQK